MTCLEVRDRLPEHAVGTLQGKEREPLERHLEWCAACRKEAGELQKAASILAFAPSPSHPDQDLEDRVVRSVRSAAGQSHHLPKGRIAALALTAALIAVFGLGWGAVMAGKAARYSDQVQAVKASQIKALERLKQVITTGPWADPSNQALIGRLDPTRGGSAGGAALELLSPSGADIAMVMVTGLAKDGFFPYTVSVVNDHGSYLKVGQITTLDSGGGGVISARFSVSLAGFNHIVITDARQQELLGGTVAAQGSAPTSVP